MAEHAVRGVQKSVREFEQLAQLKIFAPEVLKNVIKKHNDFEYRLRRRGKSESVFFDYIRFKMELLKYCRMKMESNGVSSIHKFHTESTIKNHIKKLFKTCTKLFPHSVDVWENYIKYLKLEHLDADAMHVFSAMLRYHNNPVIYIRAADFAWRTCYSVDRARKYLMEGLHIYPSEKKLYMALFTLELARTTDKWVDYKDENITEDDPVLHGLIAEGIFRTALEKFPNDLSFLFNFFLACRKCEILQKLPIIIYREIKEINKAMPELWDRIAKLQLSGMDCESNDDQIMLTTTRKLRILKCLDMYVKGLEETNGDDKTWNYYLTTVFEIPVNLSTRVSVNNYFKEIAKRPFEIEKMKPNHFLSWLNILKLQKKDEEWEVILDIACKTYPKDRNMLFMKLNHHRELGNVTEVSKIFQLSEDLDEKQQFEFWASVFNQSTSYSELELSLITNEFVKHTSLVKRFGRKFLDWSFSQGGLKMVRNTFTLIKDINSNIDLYLYIILTEKRAERSSSDNEILRKYYEEAIHKFGAEYPIVWLDYMEFQHETDKTDAIPMLYWRAIKTLQPHVIDEFMETYSLRKITQYKKKSCYNNSNS